MARTVGGGVCSEACGLVTKFETTGQFNKQNSSNALSKICCRYNEEKIAILKLFKYVWGDVNAVEIQTASAVYSCAFAIMTLHIVK